MAKRTVYICDTKDCGAVLVHPEDGFVTKGTITTTAIEGEPKVLVSSNEATDDSGETAYCKECMAKRLGLPAPA